MAARNDQAHTWADVELPYVVRYRKNGLVVPFIISAALLVIAFVSVVSFESLVAGAAPAVMGVVSLILNMTTWQHVRQIDHLRIETDGLILVATDGSMVRIPFTPDKEFAVTYEQCCRSIVVSSTEDDHWNREHIVADLLDVPRGLSIYGLCQRMNDLCRGHGRQGLARRVVAATVERSEDWYRDPARLSRLLFLAGMLGVIGLLLSVLAVLTVITHSLGPWISKPVAFAIKFGLGLLFTYPAFRFLAVGRLRDIGEPATHRNAVGLIWNKAAGSPLRLFLRRGQEGQNDFGPAPRF